MLTYYVMCLVLLLVPHFIFSVTYWQPNVAKWSEKVRAMWVVSTLVMVMLGAGILTVSSRPSVDPIKPARSWAL
jgi:ABC-type uncharacterized transport system permease subunit